MRRMCLRPRLLAVLVGMLCGVAPAAASAATFTVDDTGDVDHGHAAGTCPNPCSFRDALLAVNTGAGTGDVIGFSVITPAVINIASSLPVLNNGATIDGGNLGEVEIRGGPG